MIKKRDSRLDIIRVIAMLFVISIHISVPITDNIWINGSKSAVLYTCNGIFYMISGILNIKELNIENGLGEYKNYYLRKVIGVIIPFVFYTIIIYLYSIFDYFSTMSILGVIKGYIEYIVVTGASGHLWFMYPYFGMILSAPFIAKLLNNLRDSELWLLVLIGFVWEFFTVIILKDILLLNSVFSGWILVSWLYYFILGYCCDRLVCANKQNIWIAIGLLALIVTVVQKKLFPDRSFYAYDLSPIYTLAIIGVYFLLGKCKIRTQRLNDIIQFVSKRSFGIYIIHMDILNLVQLYSPFYEGVLGWMVALFMTFIISLFCVSIIDVLILNPICQILRKKCIYDK